MQGYAYSPMLASPRAPTIAPRPAENRLFRDPVADPDVLDSDGEDSSCYEPSKADTCRTSKSGEGEPPEQEPGTIKALVHHEKWGMFVGAIIVLNAIGMAIETDTKDWPVWPYVNNFFLIFFTFELTLRFIADGLNFFCDEDRGWNWFDFIVVVGGIIDMWILGLLMSSQSGVGRYLMILRILRLGRILRVVKFLKYSKPLKVLVLGIIEATKIVFWIAILLAIFMLIFAIFITDLAGNDAEQFDDPDAVREYFGGIVTTMITLFQFLTFDDWTNISRLVTDKLPWMRLVFNLYICVAGFAMLSLLTGVVADHMNNVSSKLKEDEKKEEQEELARFVETLRADFEKADIVHDGVLHKSEFLALCRTEKWEKDFKDKYGIQVQGKEADTLFECLDTNCNGHLSWNEFKSGLLKLRGTPERHELLRMRFACERVIAYLNEAQGNEPDVAEKIEEVSETMRDTEASLERMAKCMEQFVKWKFGDTG